MVACGRGFADRAVGLHGRPTGRTQFFAGQTRFFVTFVTFVVENRGSCCDAPYAPNA